MAGHKSNRKSTKTKVKRTLHGKVKVRKKKHRR